ncbi:MAG: single-stranded-DNA-specific exonuclease RecJ [Thermodesulfovibrionales bacterium]
MNRRWLINRTNREYLDYLSRAVSISPTLAQILINRGIKTPGDAIDFLKPNITGLSDPYEIPGMRKAIERIKVAIRNKEGLLIHGDYDVDGLTATAILTEALSKTGLNVHYFIPDRFTHGYGFNVASVKMAKKLGLRLIITVDCGITSFETVALAKREGIDVIITDHHEPKIRTDSNGQSVLQARDEVTGRRGQGTIANLSPTYSYELPEALAVLNPKLTTRDSGLSGAGVALKLVQALVIDREIPLSEDDFRSLFDLATLGTVADVVPLIKENRIIIKEGLSILSEDRRPGLKALKEVSGLKDREIKAGLLSYTIIPRINAAGRLHNATDVVRLFLSTSEEEAQGIAEYLHSANSERQAIEAEIYGEVMNEINRKEVGTVIVLANRRWHPGVLGIVAAKIAEEFYRPTFLFTIEGDVAKGSARSIPPFDIHWGISCCKDLLLSFGGHKQAAGLRLPVSNLTLFEEAMKRIIKESLTDDDFIRILKIDSEVSLTEVNYNLIRELLMLEPTGYGNPEPLLGARTLNAINPRIVGNNHLKLMLRQEEVTMDAVGFNMGNIVEDVAASSAVDAAFIPTVNEWNGGRYLQMNLKAIRPNP